MPKDVDHEQRRAEILAAAVALVAEVGLRDLTVRSIAARLGGSVTVVTHYFPTRQSLLESVAPWLLKRWQAQLSSSTTLEGDGIILLRSVLAWLLPLSAKSLADERAALSLLTAAESDRAGVGRLHAEIDPWLRGLIRVHLKGLVEEERMEAMVDLLRAATRGISVCACEDPEVWPAERQLAVLDDLLDALGLLAP